MSKALELELSGLSGKQAFDFLKEHSKKLMQYKSKGIKTFDSPAGLTYFYKPAIVDKETGVKSFSGERKAITSKEAAPADAETLRVLAAANTSMFCDSHMDVLVKNAGKKSIRENKGLLRFLHDHNWTLTGEIGDVIDVRYEDHELRELGWPQDGTAQVLVFEADLIKSWNPQVFEKYRLGRVKQHSIGLRYIALQLAVNEPDDEYWKDEYKVWKKYIDDIINKEYVESRGYFYAVTEFALLENSGVVFGSNRLTPTLSTQATDEEPDEDDEEEKSTLNQPEEIDIAQIVKGMNLFN